MNRFRKGMFLAALGLVTILGMTACGGDSDEETVAEDTTTPSALSVSIDGGAASTSSPAVTLALAASDNVGVTHYYASEYSTTPTLSISGWVHVDPAVAYSGTVSYTLSFDNGTKTVYVWFKDAAGNISNPVTAAITLYREPFTDTALRPENIDPRTVITTANHGMWIVTVGHSSEPDAATEGIDVYYQGLDTKMSFQTSGNTFTVVPMSDPAPTLATALRPENIDPGTIIILSTGQECQVLSGHSSEPDAATENVVLYLYNGNHYLSFQETGYAFAVGISVTPLFTDTAKRPENIDPKTVITTADHGMWIVAVGHSSEPDAAMENVYVYQDGPSTKMSFQTSGYIFTVVPMSDPAPTLATALRPENIDPGAILTLSTGQMFKVLAGHSSEPDAATESVVLYLYNGAYYLSFQETGYAFSVVLVTSLFNDTALRPENIDPKTIIKTTNHGMWIVTAGHSSEPDAAVESIYVYQDGAITTMSFLTSGYAFTVVPMSDPAPTLATALRPENIDPGTIITLSTGQVCQVLSGHSSEPDAATENVVLYLYNGNHYLSFQETGYAFAVGISVTPLFTDTAKRPENIDPKTIITTTSHGMWIVTAGHSSEPDAAMENVYIYQDGASVKMSFQTSGYIFTVVQMTDLAPTIATATRPENIDPGTILTLSTGQMCQVLSGHSSEPDAATESVVLYLYNGNHYLSFQETGYAFMVKLL